ncbi:iron-containing redox enzyme family protein [Microtetraspora sp. NBRC 13810]|uniref:iron-containing redox enzyme family protein n=1 Tax=Microtetraspora sp. NBRC 13810 TaxID=3030990 RepID=UPI002556B97D|nr:iron-containing redox enzyme family protein [Microtetraspora sp. NBRC 13810]
MTSASGVLRATISLAAPALLAASARLWRADDLERRYPEYLRVMHAVIRATVPLLVAARDRSHERGEARLADYFDEHAREEAGHDEWLKEDLAVIGRSTAVTPPPLVAELVGAQYYWVLHHHPVSLLGYIAVMEGHPPTASLIAHLERLTGYPRAAFRTMRVHAEADIGHRAAVDALLDRLAPDPAACLALRISALHSMRTSTELLRGLAGEAATIPARYRFAGGSSQNRRHGAETKTNR